MTDLATLDEQIAAWEERLGRVDENLLALEADATYQLLSGAGRATVEGLTRDRLAPALEAMQRLFEQRERLRAILDRAKVQRAEIGTFTLFKDDKVAVIDELLHGASISIAGVEKPVEERGLLDAATRDVAVVPEELLRAMIAGYEIARDAVGAVRKAWSKLEPAIEEIERDFGATRRRLEGEPSMKKELDALEGSIGALRRRVAADPLGVDRAALDGARAQIAALDRRAAEELGAIERLRAARETAEELRREIDAAAGDSRLARDALTRDFKGAAAPEADREAMRALDAWLAKIDETASEGHARRAEIGLGRWLDDARGHLASTRAAIELHVKLEGEKTELAGRLSARRAQLEAFRARGATVGPELLELVTRAESLLAHRPLSLAEARATIDAIDRAVAKLRR